LAVITYRSGEENGRERTDWLTYQETEQMSEWMNEWMSNQHMDWLTYWLIKMDWLTSQPYICY
jgi:hypothetical protein